MKLYFASGACSLGIHLLLEEIGAPYETEAVNLRAPVPERALTAINPKSKVPTLVRDDGSVLTEYPAIAYWLARSHPQAKLFPDALEAQTRTLETLDYCVSTLHMQGFARLFMAMFAATPAEAEPLAKLGHVIVDKGLARLDALLGGREWVVDSYSIADSAIYYATRWAPMFKVALPPHVAAHFERMNARPAVQRTLAAEGLA